MSQREMESARTRRLIIGTSRYVYVWLLLRAENLLFWKVIPNLRNQRHKKLVSPSCASDPNGQKWIADWMHLVKDSPPDYVGIHWYGTSSDEAKKYIEAMHKKFPGNKIIISEIGSISRDKHDVYRFTQRMCNWMDEQDFIFEYGFFGYMKTMPNNFVSPEARLMNPDASFTDLMHNYITQQPWK